MPTRPLSPCRHPGCAELLPRPGYCDAHRRSDAKALYDDRRRDDDAVRIRNSIQWQRVRALHRRVEPFCRDPFGAHGMRMQPNQQSHHIQPLATHAHLAFDLSNLAGLCTSCHTRIERMERAGTATQSLFPSRNGE